MKNRKDEFAASINIKVLSGWGMPAGVLAPFAQALRQCGQQLDRGEFRVDEWDAHTLMSWATSWAHESSEKNTGEIPDRPTPVTSIEDEHILERAAIALGLSTNTQRHGTTASEAPKECWLIGWSLGGMLAVALAHRYPEPVTGVITLGANACFSTQADWPNAMPRSTFEQFYKRFQRSPERALKRFAFLCTSLSTEPVNHNHTAENNDNPGNRSIDIDRQSTPSDGESKPLGRVMDQDTSTSSKRLESLSASEVPIKPGLGPQESARLLEESMLASLDTPSTHSTLLKGLDLLSQLDNREALVALHCPQLHLLAEGDMLVPLTAAEDIKALIRLNHRAECAVVPGAHNFPITAAEASASVILRFIKHRSVQPYCVHPRSSQHHNLHLQSLYAQ